jgi:hypothetical protein
MNGCDVLTLFPYAQNPAIARGKTHAAMSIYAMVTPLRIGSFDVFLEFDGIVPCKAKTKFFN